MLGVDIGTTSTKTVVFTLDGKVVAQHAEYRSSVPNRAWRNRTGANRGGRAGLHRRRRQGRQGRTAGDALLSFDARDMQRHRWMPQSPALQQHHLEYPRLGLG
jgi:N-acetylglucosamine kinase-like BadF-type ATPase